jgi:hypothetical protein
VGIASPSLSWPSTPTLDTPSALGRACQLWLRANVVLVERVPVGNRQPNFVVPSIESAPLQPNPQQVLGITSRRLKSRVRCHQI